jgi:phosphatidylserine decarboxylase
MIKAQFTRLIRPILDYIKERVEPGSMSKLAFDSKDYKAILFSMHDTETIFTMKMLNPTNFHFKHIPYASSVVYELYKEGDSYEVEVRFNGI